MGDRDRYEFRGSNVVMVVAFGAVLLARFLGAITWSWYLVVRKLSTIVRHRRAAFTVEPQRLRTALGGVGRRDWGDIEIAAPLLRVDPGPIVGLTGRPHRHRDAPGRPRPAGSGGARAG
jgi:hypothetical protein